VRVQFVSPLTKVLALLHAFGIEKVDATELGERFEASVSADHDLANLTRGRLVAGRRLLESPAPPAVPGDLDALASVLHERARPSEHVNWALVEPIAMMIDALLWRLDGIAVGNIGCRLEERFNEWSARMPITGIWGTLSTYALREELIFLETTLLRTGDARRRFGRRLVAGLDGDKARVVERRWIGGHHAG
jgi:hypothetical protein